MISVRDGWYEEIGGPPPGNKLALERNMWQTNREVTTESISDKAELAQKLADKLYVNIRKYGLKEEIVPNPQTLLDGVVEFIRKDQLSPEQLEKYQEQIEYKKRATQVSKVVIDGEEAEFSVYYHKVYETKGGVMCDITSKYKNDEANHRVIVGKDYYEPYGIFPNQVVERCIGFMLINKIPRKTEGILAMNQFPSNYFAVADLHMWYPELEDMFNDLGIDKLKEGYWSFNRSARWVAEDENPEGLNIALGRDQASLLKSGRLLADYG